MAQFRNLLPALLGLALVPMAAPAQAGVILIPITEIVGRHPGSTMLRQLADGRYQITTRDLKLEGAACDAEGNCSYVYFNQDLRIIIDFTGSGISGQSRGEIVFPGTTKFFQGRVDGEVINCLPNGEPPCGAVELRVRTQARVDQENGSLSGIIDLEWVGTVERTDSKGGGWGRTSAGAWSRISGLADIATFDSDFTMDGYDW